MDPKYHNQILGMEPPIWTERVPNWLRMDYQVFPRTIAYSETGWTPASKKNYKQFQNRLKLLLPRLDLLGVNYAPVAEWNNSFKMRFIPNAYRMR